MTDIDRRMLLGTAGAAMALAGCKAEGTPEGKREIKPLLAPCVNHGDEPKFDGKDPPPSKKHDWKPEHFCLVYVNMDGGVLTAKHAYFKTGLTDAIPKNAINKPFPSIAAMAADILGRVTPTSSWPKEAVAYGTNFSNFNFGSQQEIYILIDGQLAKADDENLIVFSARPTKPSGKHPEANAAFYNAQIWDTTIKGKKVIYLQNWFTYGNSYDKIKKKDKPENKYPPEYVHSMNIHILLGAAGIPGVIDPDTGNGTDWNP